MKLKHSLARIALATAAAALLAPAASAQDAEPLQVLMITGGGWHDYDNQKTILEEGISSRANVEFTIDHEAGGDEVQISRHDDDQWARDFDVVLYNMCFAAVTDSDYVESIVHAHVEHRTPAVMLHCALHSYSHRGDNPIWWEFLGAHSPRHQSHMPFTVEVKSPKHPIMAYFPDEWETPQGELYNIQTMMPTANPLAHAYGEDTDAYHNNIWINDYKGVPVFVTSIGHHNETMEDDNYLNLVTSGLLWVAGKLDYDGDPADGYAGENFGHGYQQ